MGVKILKSQESRIYEMSVMSQSICRFYDDDTSVNVDYQYKVFLTF